VYQAQCGHKQPPGKSGHIWQQSAEYTSLTEDIVTKMPGGRKIATIELIPDSSMVAT